jgi:hypothetical protein
MSEAESAAGVSSFLISPSSFLEIMREKKGSKESGVKPARVASSRRERESRSRWKDVQDCPPQPRTVAQGDERGRLPAIVY